MNRILSAFLRVLLCVMCFATQPVASQTFAASTSKSISLNDEQTQAVNKVSAYLNSFTTMQADFTQISPKGSMTKGVMFLSKPGKIRFDYAAPNPFLLVSDGTWVTLKNRAKETGDQFPLSATPLRLVLAPKIDVLKDTDISSLDQKDGLISITLKDRKSSMAGEITLVFDSIQNQLQQWVLTDGKGRRTTVVLENLMPDVSVDPKIFIVKINRKTKSDR